FCWSLRRMFARAGIAYRSIDLDSVEYQADGRGGKIRAALTARTTMTTIPQVFFAGEFIGGCTETLDAFKNGRLQQIMDRSGVSFDRTMTADPYSFLPAWLHPRG
ncbi:MAG: glutaredoxin domain-containing protein, partial [Pseudomonadota bacterium]